MALVLDGDNGIIGVLATNTDGDVIFDTNTLFVDAVENKVGIGTITPVRQLHLASSVPSIRLEDTDVSGAYNDIVHLSTGELSIRVDHGNVQSNSSLSFLIDADEKMRINTDGNVGIGTTNPQRKLVVYQGDSGQAQIQFQNVTTGSVAGDGFGVGLDSSEKGFIWNYEGNDTYIGGAGGTSITIQNGGNVGIGTDSPSYKLDVASTIQIRAGESLRLQNVAGSSAATIQCAGAGTNSDLGFSTAGAERMRITSTGVLQGTSDAEIATSPIRTHSNTISTSTTIDANDNAVASGPLAIADGVTLTINGNMTVV
jgi:hypothetical protein